MCADYHLNIPGLVLAATPPTLILSVFNAIHLFFLFCQLNSELEIEKKSRTQLTWPSFFVDYAQLRRKLRIRLWDEKTKLNCVKTESIKVSGVAAKTKPGINDQICLAGQNQVLFYTSGSSAFWPAFFR